MIEQNTVFILGAGASYSSGFPTGPELVSQILCLRRDFHATYCHHIKDFLPEQSDAFFDALDGSKHTSIDAFLENRQEFLEVGKIAIAHILGKKEQSSFTISRIDSRMQQDGHWYDLLLDEYLASRLANFEQNSVTFVTFNYDRSLEHFLISALPHRFGIPTEKAASLLRSIPVHHVHGQIGRLPWQNGEGFVREFAPPDTQAVVESAKGIRVVWEEVESSIEVELSQTAVREAKTVLFIGFGYDARNLQHFRDLFLSGELDNEEREVRVARTVVGTGLGLSHHKREQLMDRYRPLKLHDMTAFGFLRECRQAIDTVAE